MAIVWLASKRVNNAGWVDVAWSYSFTLVVTLSAALGSAPAFRKLLFCTLVGIWSLRLGTYLAVRVGRHHPTEDARYAALREQFPKRPWLMFFGFFQLQGVLTTILAIPIFAMAANPSPTLSGWEFAGLGLWLLAFAGEALSDSQLAAFRKHPENRGKVCDRGLWKFSRHPNYFFEWLIWVSYAVLAMGSPGGWAGILSPIIMYLLLTKVTGIPPAEEQSLRSRGDAYRAYQTRTSAFFPLPPKSTL
jgi:steroid 5-alpha reductase family enzyme